MFSLEKVSAAARRKVLALRDTLNVFYAYKGRRYVALEMLDSRTGEKYVLYIPEDMWNDVDKRARAVLVAE